jgi:ABC-type polysaccharide/polyol phosphate transport system ATPase subunit
MGCCDDALLKIPQTHCFLGLTMAAIVVKDVTLEFPIYGMQRSLRRVVLQRAAGGLIRPKDAEHRHVTVTALTNISFELRDGDRLGLIGHNGAGKSSLLKVLAGVYEPTSGEVWVDGHITSLFDLHPGLDAEATGYETITTIGMLLGLRRNEIAGKVPEIEKFSELGEYLSLPIRTYSTGMATRLGFSIATVLDPEILLLDEDIGASDARFTARVAARLEELARRSAILVLASHTDELIRAICNKAALLEAGRIVRVGQVDEVLADYHEKKSQLAQSP